MATTSQDNIQLRVIVDGSPARKELAQVNQDLVKLKETQKELREEQQALNAARKAAKANGDTAELQRLNTALEQNRKKLGESTNAIADHTAKQTQLRHQIGDTALSFSELSGKARGLQAALNRAVPNTPEARKLAAELFTLKERMKEVGGQAGLQAQAWDHLRQGLKVTDMSMRQLRLEQDRLNNALEKTKPNTKEYATLHGELGRVDARMRTLRTGMGPFGQAWAAVKGQVMGATAVLGTFLAGGALVNLFGGMIKSSAELSDAMANVRRTTGLTTGEVEGLVNQFKNLDTRTPRAELLALAADAGKLGIKGSENVMAFVRAGDQLRVALGEDLGDDAIKNIGKLVDLFKLKDQFGLEDSMLKVGSTLNELGMATTASEGYMVEFLKRMGGIAPIAGITIQQTLALGATLDSLGQTSEVSSTALSKLFVKLGSDAEKYAKLAGMSVDEFTAILKNNALEGFIAVLEGTKKTEGGVVALAETLGDIGIDAARAAGVFGVLGANTDRLREQMDIANRAFEQGTSITDEFRLKNETLAATLAKMQKEIYQTFITTGVVDMVKEWVAQFRELMQWVRDNGETFKVFGQVLLTVGTAFVTYKAVVLATVAASRAGMALTAAWTTLKGLFTSQVARATAAQTAFNAATKLNPVGLLIAGLVTAVTVIQRYSAATKAAADAAANETTKLQILHSQILATNKGSDERRKLIDQLKAQYPEYLSQINSESVSNAELAASIELVNKKLINKAVLAATDQTLEEQNARAAKEKIRMMQAEKEARELIAMAVEKTGVTLQEGTLVQQATQLLAVEGAKKVGIGLRMELNRSLQLVREYSRNAEREEAKSNEMLADRQEQMKALGLATEETGNKTLAAARTLQMINEEIVSLEAQLAAPEKKSDHTIAFIKDRIDALKEERDALFQLKEEATGAARTLAVINEEIKGLKEQQEKTSTSRSEYLAIEEKIKALEREKVAIEGVQGSGAKARQKAVDDLKAHEQALKEFHERMLQDTLSADEKELRQLDVKHVEELAKLKEHQAKLVAAKKLTPVEASTNVDTLTEAQARERIELLEKHAQDRWKVLQEANEKIQQQLGESHNKQLQMEVEHWEHVVQMQREMGSKSVDGVMLVGGPSEEAIKSLHAARLALYQQNANDLLAQETANWDAIISDAKAKLAEYEAAIAATGTEPSDDVQAEVTAQHAAILDLEAKKNAALEAMGRAHREKEQEERRKETLAIRQEYARRVQNVANWARAVADIMGSLLEVRDAEIAAAEQRADADGERDQAEIAGIERLKEARRKAASTHLKVQMAAAIASGVASVLASPIPFPGNLIAAAGSIATIIGLFAKAKSLLSSSGSGSGDSPTGATQSLNAIPEGAQGLGITGAGKVLKALDGGGVLGGSYHGQGRANLLIDSNTGKPLAEVEKDELMLIMSRKATAANADLIPMMLEASRKGERLPILDRPMAMPNPTKVGQAMRVVHMANGGVSGPDLNNLMNSARMRLVDEPMGPTDTTNTAALMERMLGLMEAMVSEQRETRKATEQYPTKLHATTSIREGERTKLEYDYIQRLNKGRNVA